MSTPPVIRIAIVGSGPAGFYTAEHLHKHSGHVIEIDMFERLATPFGLVRFGVAPDHEKIKSVTKAYERIATNPNFRFLGGVELGRDLTAEDLDRHYHAVVLAVGAPVDRRMGIPGEDIPGSLSATDFVAWYNGHPEYRNLEIDLQVEDVVVVGNGNVAVDVARILTCDPDVLARTDIADHALAALRTSRVRRVTMLGRRGPAQAAFTPKEVRELGELAGVTVRVDPADLVAPKGSDNEDAQRVLGALAGVAGRTPSGEDREINLAFLRSPIALHGENKVSGVTVVQNELVEDQGALRASATDRVEEIPAGLVFRAVGYRGQAVPGYPFDETRAVIPNDLGRIVGEQPGRYVAGWIKRGPQGVIGTNKADAGETVERLLEDLAAGALATPTAPTRPEVDALLAERGCIPVAWEDWRRIDAAERAAGASTGRPRRKFTSNEEIREVLGR